VKYKPVESPPRRIESIVPSVGQLRALEELRAWAESDHVRDGDRREHWRGKQVVLAYLRDGQPRKSIAREFGLSHQRIHQILEQFGLSRQLRELHYINQAWAARPCDLANVRMGPCEGQAEPYFPTFGYGGEKMAFYCRRHGQIIEDM
jgi:hypothetical protein